MEEKLHEELAFVCVCVERGGGGGGGRREALI